jgi:hypothetical protein
MLDAPRDAVSAPDHPRASARIVAIRLNSFASDRGTSGSR